MLKMHYRSFYVESNRVTILLGTGFAGPRYDSEGHVVSHSILGNYDDFQKEAIERGDLLVC